jgi:CRP/FNR family transcriptional regulator, cyclic AMP receptor protein
MMSQNRQNTRDRLRGDLDFEVNRRAETEIQGLARKLNQIDDKMHDFENMLRRTAHISTPTAQS